MDLKNNILVKRVISPHSPAATGTITGTVVDRANFDSVTFVISSGAQTTAGITVTPVVKAGAATSSLASVGDSLLVGTEAAVNTILKGTAGANKCGTVGYIGNLRYVSSDLIVAGAATGLYAAQAILSDPRKAPQTQS